MFGRHCLVEVPGAKSAISDCTLFVFKFKNKEFLVLQFHIMYCHTLLFGPSVLQNITLFLCILVDFPIHVRVHLLEKMSDVE